MSNNTGVLYIVATPIGNLEDISARTRRILAEVDLIAAEDTRHSKKLLNGLGIKKSMQPYHDFNEQDAAVQIVDSLKQGKRIALISDAGTPLINDPGYRLVSLAHEEGIQVVPVPGPAALICALSAGGLATDRFVFEGFAPEKRAARVKHFAKLQMETRTIIFYEAPHRIAAFMEDAASVFGDERLATLARELTKKFETIKRARISDLLNFLREDQQQQKGEFVVLIEGRQEETGIDDFEAKRILGVLLSHLGVKAAAAATADITGRRKNELYQLALEISDNK